MVARSRRLKITFTKTYLKNYQRLKMSSMRGGERPGSGRKKGSVNKKTLEWKAFGRKLMTYGTARAERILENCDDASFMFYFLKLADYFQPKPRQGLDVSLTNPD